MDGSVLERLARGPEVTMEQLVVLSTAFLRGLGRPTRIMWSLDPSPLRPEDVFKQLKEVQAKKSNVAKRKRGRQGVQIEATRESEQDTSGRDEASENKEHKSTRKRKCDVELEVAMAMAMEASSWVTPVDQPREANAAVSDDRGPEVTTREHLDWRYWIEVYSPQRGSWQPLHLVPLPGKPAISHVVAFNGRGAKDLTRKYCDKEDISRVLAKRDEGWWNQTMSSLRRGETMALRRCLEDRRDDTAVAELAERTAAQEDHQMVAKEEEAHRQAPATIKAFQNHPHYILKRHVKTHQVIKPGTNPVGVLKGEPYFNRSDLCAVHTAQEWKRQGRQVKESELDQPVKLIKKRGVQHTEAELEGMDPSTSQQLMSSFYGPWQTNPWVPPAAKDGVVPKNEYGSVEVPPLCHTLPGGTVHVDLPEVAKVCRQLGIDYAEAVSGFEYRKRRMVPKKCGVVVCCESEDILRGAWSEYTRHQSQLAKEKRMAQGEAAWRDLIAALLTHIRVHRSFANGDDVEAALLEHASKKKDILIGKVRSKGSKNLASAETRHPKESTEVDLDVEEI